MFEKISTRLSLHLTPNFISCIDKGIDEKLNRMLLKYSKEFQGVVVSYSNIRDLDRLAEIYFDSPLLHFKVTVDFLVFAPKIGDLITGCVNKQSSDHLGLLVCGFFNAVVCEMVGYKWNDGVWVKDQVQLEIGSFFEFVVCDICFVNGVLSLSGKIPNQKGLKNATEDKKSKSTKKLAKEKKASKDKLKAHEELNGPEKNAKKESEENAKQQDEKKKEDRMKTKKRKKEHEIQSHDKKKKHKSN